jgi:hypothetical protein
MPCDLCRNFPSRALRELNNDIELGELSIAEIAEKHYVSVALLEDHAKQCVTPLPDQGHELLDSLLRELRRVSADLKEKYEYDPDLYASAMPNYLSAMREAREMILAMERIRPSEELEISIIDQILTPLVQLMVTIQAEEAERLREDITPIIGSQHYRMIDKSIKRSCGRFASRLQGEMSTLTDRLHSVLTATTKTGKEKKKRRETNKPDPATIH